MKSRPRSLRVRCHHCARSFVPDPRLKQRHRYCHRPDCRRASRAHSQAKWLNRPENAHYFRGAANALRVKLWRAANPRPKGRSRRKEMERLIQPRLAAALKAGGVQDLSERQLALVLGLISALAQSSVQDVIARRLRRLMFAGYAVLRADEPPDPPPVPVPKS